VPTMTWQRLSLESATPPRSLGSLCSVSSRLLQHASSCARGNCEGSELWNNGSGLWGVFSHLEETFARAMELHEIVAFASAPLSSAGEETTPVLGSMEPDRAWASSFFSKADAGELPISAGLRAIVFATSILNEGGLQTYALMVPTSLVLSRGGGGEVGARSFKPWSLVFLLSADELSSPPPTRLNQSQESDLTLADVLEPLEKNMLPRLCRFYKSLDDLAFDPDALISLTWAELPWAHGKGSESGEKEALVSEEMFRSLLPDAEGRTANLRTWLTSGAGWAISRCRADPRVVVTSWNPSVGRNEFLLPFPVLHPAGELAVASLAGCTGVAGLDPTEHADSPLELGGLLSQKHMDTEVFFTPSIQLAAVAVRERGRLCLVGLLPLQIAHRNARLLGPVSCPWIKAASSIAGAPITCHLPPGALEAVPSALKPFMGSLLSQTRAAARGSQEDLTACVSPSASNGDEYTGFEEEGRSIASQEDHMTRSPELPRRRRRHRSRKKSKIPQCASELPALVSPESYPSISHSRIVPVSRGAPRTVPAGCLLPLGVGPLFAATTPSSPPVTKESRGLAGGKPPLDRQRGYDEHLSAHAPEFVPPWETESPLWSVPVSAASESPLFHRAPLAHGGSGAPSATLHSMQAALAEEYPPPHPWTAAPTTSTPTTSMTTRGSPQATLSDTASVGMGWTNPRQPVVRGPGPGSSVAVAAQATRLHATVLRVGMHVSHSRLRLQISAQEARAAMLRINTSADTARAATLSGTGNVGCTGLVVAPLRTNSRGPARTLDFASGTPVILLSVGEGTAPILVPASELQTQLARDRQRLSGGTIPCGSELSASELHHLTKVLSARTVVEYTPVVASLREDDGSVYTSTAGALVTLPGGTPLDVGLGIRWGSPSPSPPRAMPHLPEESPGSVRSMGSARHGATHEDPHSASFRTHSSKYYSPLTGGSPALSMASIASDAWAGRSDRPPATSRRHDTRRGVWGTHPPGLGLPSDDPDQGWPGPTVSWSGADPGWSPYPSLGVAPLPSGPASPGGIAFSSEDPEKARRAAQRAVRSGLTLNSLPTQ
jgi:sarcosine oxidase gamma subunit